MKKKVFLDTSVIYRLAFIDKHSDIKNKSLEIKNESLDERSKLKIEIKNRISKLKEERLKPKDKNLEMENKFKNLNKSDLKAIMLISKKTEYNDGRMALNKRSINEVIQLYRDIINGKVEPYICSTVYQEVLNVKNIKKGIYNARKIEAEKQGIKFIEELGDVEYIERFVNEHFTLSLPKRKDAYVAHVYKLQESLKSKVKSVQIGNYLCGLNDEQAHSDYDDRTILSEIAVLSEYSNEMVKDIDLKSISENDFTYYKKIRSDIMNKKGKNKDIYINQPLESKEYSFYHFNYSDYGTRVKNEAFDSKQSFRNAKELADNVQNSLERDDIANIELNLNIRHISEYYKDNMEYYKDDYEMQL